MIYYCISYLDIFLLVIIKNVQCYSIATMYGCCFAIAGFTRCSSLVSRSEW